MIREDCACSVLMVRPYRFGFNAETAASNRYQRSAGAEAEEVASLAAREFDGLAQALVDAGVEVIVFDDTPKPHTPDALFPNNWVSFHADGTCVLYPMLTENRRAEVRPEFIERLADEHGMRWTKSVDLTALAAEGVILEGTGSLVLDRPNRVAYACRSPRTTERGLAAFADRMDYAIEPFRAIDGGVEVYHTNVMMGIGPKFAAICLEAIEDGADAKRVSSRLEAGGREVIALDRTELHGFAGNLLALQSVEGAQLVVLSAGAWESLRPQTQRSIERHGTVVTAPLATIEALGGGSARCMLAELYPPR